MTPERKRLDTQRQVRKKAALEIILSRRLRARYAQISALFTETLSEPDVSDVRLGVVEDLNVHYSTVNASFINEVPSDLGVTMPSNHRSLAIFAFGVWVSSRVNFQAARITATARNRITRTIRRVLTVDRPATRAEVLDQAKRIAGPMLKNHARTAATLETQAAAEVTKSQVAEVLAGRLPNVLMSSPGISAAPLPSIVVPTKTWFTELDSRVRDRHAATEGQVRGVSELFNVGGQTMLFPTDTSHGADLANIINCRCSALYDRGT